jgi:hypothetical protein
MNIIVKAGEGLLAKKWFENPSDIVIAVPENNSIVPRKDSVIIQMDLRESGRIPNIVYRTGIANSNPVPPELSTADNVVEKRVANIYVAAGTTQIEQNAIQDLRGTSECLWITSLVQQVDTSTLFMQWQRAFEEYYQNLIEELQNVRDGSAYVLKSGGTMSGLLKALGGIEGNLTGNADTADKLKDERRIDIVGAVLGNANFDGSNNIVINTTPNNIKVLTADLRSDDSGEISYTFTLPEGYSGANCVPIATSIQTNYGAAYYESTTTAKNVYMNYEGYADKLRVNFSPVAKNTNLTIRVVLLKLT